MGDRRERGRAQGAASAAWHVRRFSHPGRRSEAPRHLGGSGHRVPVLARPSLRARASRVVQAAPRWHGAVRGESAEEIPGHLSLRLRDARVAKSVGRAQKHLRVLARPRGDDLPCRQSAHQGFRFLGVVHWRAEGEAPGTHPALGSIHPAAGDAQARQARLHAVLHLFHMAQLALRAGGVFHRADEGPVERIFPSERMAQYAGHPARLPPEWRAAGVHHARRACRDARGELRHLRTGL